MLDHVDVTLVCGWAGLVEGGGGGVNVERKEDSKQAAERNVHDSRPPCFINVSITFKASFLRHMR